MKRVLSRLEEQLKNRLPEREAEDLIAVLLDPLTKPFAKLWLGNDGYKKAKNVLKKKHRELYVKIQAMPESEALEQLGADDHNSQDLDVPVSLLTFFTPK